MTVQTETKQEERVLAAVAHGSILVALLTSGLGGILAATVIWLTQREKSGYAAFQALQALGYQVVTFVVSAVTWTCWGLAWMAMILPPLFASPAAYENAPPAGLWIGLILVAGPVAVHGLTVLYALWAALRCLGGQEFRYAIIGGWLEGHAQYTHRGSQDGA